MASTSKMIEDLSIAPGTISSIIDDPIIGLKVNLNVTDDEVERVRKEAEQQQKGTSKKADEDVKSDEVTGDKIVNGDGDKVQNGDDAEEAAVTESNDEPMGDDEGEECERAEEVKASGVDKRSIDLEGGDEVEGVDVNGGNFETEGGDEVVEADGGDELNEGDVAMEGDDSDLEDDQSEESDATDYDTEVDEAAEGIEVEEGDGTNAGEQVDGVELANIGQQPREGDESDEEESESDDNDSDFDEEQSGADKGFIKIMTLGDSFGVIIQGSGARLSPRIQKKAKSGKYIMIQLKNEPDIPKCSNVVIELQPDVCELFGKDAYNAMLKGDWSKMVKIAKKKGCPYPEILNKLRTSQGKAPIKIKQRY